MNNQSVILPIKSRSLKPEFSSSCGLYLAYVECTKYADRFSGVMKRCHYPPYKRMKESSQGNKICNHPSPPKVLNRHGN